MAAMRASKVFCATVLLTGSLHLAAVEAQSHGLQFEKWLCETFFGGYQPKSLTQKWDIPAAFNPDYGRVPVNPKAVKFKTPIGLGDALRQFEINESFLLIVGFWEQVTDEEKRWVKVQTVQITPAIWASLWHPLTRRDLEALDAVVKDKTLGLEEARKRAHDIKSQPPYTQAVIQVNPKIDRSQRRLQCSLRFEDFFSRLAPGASQAPEERPHVFGVPLPSRFESGPRKMSP
jgi:hypothetical protein